MPQTVRPTAEIAVRVCVVVMPLACWPLQIVRRPELTLIHFEARATRRENTEAILASCTPEETDIIRAAYRMPAGVTQEWALSDEPALLWVPPDLRLPGWPALQGGVELDRRRIAGESLEMELACLDAEDVVVTAAAGGGRGLGA